jgi:hypothetical protein
MQVLARPNMTSRASRPLSETVPAVTQPITSSIEWASHRAFDGSGVSLKLASDLDLEPVRVAAAMALADVMRLTTTPSFFSDVGDGWLEHAAVEGITLGSALACGT